MERGILFIATALLAALALLVLRILLTSDVRWSSLLSEGYGRPGVARTTFLFANLALAATFLSGVMEWGRNPSDVAALENATAFFDGWLESSALTGGAATAYAWAKLGGRSPGR